MSITIPEGYILYANRGKGDESDQPIVERDTLAFLVVHETSGGIKTHALFFQHDKGKAWMTHAILSDADVEELGING